MEHGKVTVLGDAASDHEIFMISKQREIPPELIHKKCNAERLKV